MEARPAGPLSETADRDRRNVVGTADRLALVHRGNRHYFTGWPSGFDVFGALAEFERSIIRERTTAGLAAARARGRVGGRPKTLSESDLHIAKMLLQDGRLTGAPIAQRLGVAPSTLYKHLPRPRSTITYQAPE